MINAEDLVVSRGRTEILHHLKFCIPKGSVTGLMGPSGCGKTTLMRSVVGVQRITAGTLTIDGVAAGDETLRSRIGYTSQGISIYSDISVRDNVSYFARIKGVNDSRRVDELIERVNLAPFASRRISELSGGQAGRASLACALVGEPDLLILDEPTVGLDPLTRESLWGLFRDLANQGTTLLISSHVMDEATRCDSVLFMRDGNLLAHESMTRLQAQTSTSSAEAAFLALIKKD